MIDAAAAAAAEEEEEDILCSAWGHWTKKAATIEFLFGSGIDSRFQKHKKALSLCFGRPPGPYTNSNASRIAWSRPAFRGRTWRRINSWTSPSSYSQTVFAAALAWRRCCSSAASSGTTRL